MIQLALTKLKQWTSFPTVKQPPQTIVSDSARKLVIMNVALALGLYALGDSVIALVSIGFFTLAITAKRSTKLDNIIQQRWFLLLISLACVALFLIRFHGSTGGKSWMGLLALLTAIKVFETRQLRDYFVSIILLYFFTAIIFSYHNSAIAPVFLALFSISTATALMLLSSSNSTEQKGQTNLQSLGVKHVVKKASWLFTQALPITIILFFLFPRIQGTFGFLPDESSNLNPGFGDSLKAGDFRKRSFSDDIAFRAEFIGAYNFSSEDLYWRVKTLTKQQGINWSKSAVDDTYKNKPSSTVSAKTSETTVNYTITHQPTADTQLPSLETVISSSTGVILNNHSLKTENDFSSPFQYDLTSSLSKTDNYSQVINQPQIAAYLGTASAPKNNTRKLMDSWLVENGLSVVSDSTRVLSSEKIKHLSNRVLEYFRSQPFKYHLLPPELDKSEAIEDFLFRTRSGYCEHYASTYSSLMRWMGVPSRVVVGYQGGEYNDQGRFFEVRYSNAHAWSEIWTQDDGWIRVDPTAAVAPERIEFGMEALLALMTGDQEFESGQYNKKKLADALNPKGSKRFFKSISHWLSSANHTWDKWVVNYGYEQQKELKLKTNM